MMRWMVPPTLYPADLRQVQRLRHDTLPGERCVAVNQQREHRVGPNRPLVDRVHLRSSHADDHRVDGFKM